MRVGVVTTSYPRAPGDPAGSFVAAHVDWLVAAGHTVEVLCAGAARAAGAATAAERAGAARAAERAGAATAAERAGAATAAGTEGEAHAAWQPGVRVVPVAAPPGLFYQGGAPEALAARGSAAAVDVARFSAALLRAVWRHARGWDAAFAHWLAPCGAALALAAPPGLRLVAIAHSGDVHLLRRLGLATPLAWALLGRRARLACVSEHVRERLLGGVRPAWLARALRARSLVTPMGVDVERWRAVAAQVAGQRAGEAQGAGAAERGTGRRTVLFLGRLVPIKGVAVLFEAVARLPPVCSPVRVIVAGDGPLRAELAARARALADRCAIELVGEVRGAARDRLVASADVLVLPSLPVAGGRSEGAPVTALEAMAAGVPVVASRTGGLAELPPGTATLVPPGDAAALAQGLARCLTDDALRGQQIAAASRWVARHDWAEVGARLWRLASDAG
ncbi:MAG TPA: glycosyltransferase family 4 protein [Haliangium sp.]|nr:glycosyltransferase family 4 protein [Haliangium sp.]